MFDYITGTVMAVSAESSYASAVVECGGIGYALNISTESASRAQVGEVTRFFTHFHITENNVALYGFIEREERDMFHILISVTGVGPKAALSLLSAMSPSKVAVAVATEDDAMLSKAQGIGKKTAQRIIIELRDKIKGFDALADMAAESQERLPAISGGGAKNDAVDALVALGYQRGEVVRCVLEIALPGLTGEQIVKAALKKLGRF